MKKVGLTLITLAALAIVGVVSHDYITTPKEEGVCKLKTVSSVPYLYEYDIVNFFWTTDKKPEIKPESLVGIPETVEGRKIFFTIPFTHRDLNGCLFDHGRNRYTIYADLNGDDSLADEKPIISRKKRYYNRDDSIYLFGPVSLKSDDAAAPFYLFLTNFTEGIHIAPTTVKKGKIKINGAVHKVMLADLDFDGEYKTYFSPECLKPGGLGNPNLCDRLLFDVDRDGKFINRYYIEMENGPISKLINIRKQYYAVQIMERNLLISPVSPEFGTLKLNTYQSSMCLYSDSYSCCVFATNTSTLPVGKYSVIKGVNQYKDSNDSIWTCYAKPSLGSAIDFKILENQETILEFPTSFLLKTEIAYKDGKCGINIKLFSKDDKEYGPLFRENDKAVDKPAITIYDDQNVIMHTGQMEYG